MLKGIYIASSEHNLVKGITNGTRRKPAARAQTLAAIVRLQGRCASIGAAISIDLPSSIQDEKRRSSVSLLRALEQWSPLVVAARPRWLQLRMPKRKQILWKNLKL